MSVQSKIRGYFNKYCRLDSVFGDFTKDEKRLQDEFDDERLKFRYNLKLGFCQVWYDADRLTVLMNLEHSPNVCKAIWELKRRQKSRRELLEWYEEHQRNVDQVSQDKINDTVGTVADAARSWSVGKVTTSGKGLTLKEKK